MSLPYREPKRYGATRPEDKLYHEVRKHLEAHGWLVIKTHGNQFQSGLPDLYIAHPMYGTRWVELKTPEGTLTKDQVIVFRKMFEVNVEIYIVWSVASIGDPYKHTGIFGKGNWTHFLDKKSKDIHMTARKLDNAK